MSHRRIPLAPGILRIYPPSSRNTPKFARADRGYGFSISGLIGRFWLSFETIIQHKSVKLGGGVNEIANQIHMYPRRTDYDRRNALQQRICRGGHDDGDHYYNR